MLNANRVVGRWTILLVDFENWRSWLLLMEFGFLASQVGQCSVLRSGVDSVHFAIPQSKRLHVEVSEVRRVC